MFGYGNNRLGWAAINKKKRETHRMGDRWQFSVSTLLGSTVLLAVSLAMIVSPWANYWIFEAPVELLVKAAYASRKNYAIAFVFFCGTLMVPFGYFAVFGVAAPWAQFRLGWSEAIHLLWGRCLILLHGLFISSYVGLFLIAIGPSIVGDVSDFFAGAGRVLFHTSAVLWLASALGTGWGLVAAISGTNSQQRVALAFGLLIVTEYVAFLLLWSVITILTTG